VTSATKARGTSNSAKTRSFSSGYHCQCRSTPVLIFTGNPAPVLNDALKSALKITRGVQRRKAVVRGRIR